MISIHLSDEEITAAAVGERPPRTDNHLQICAECQDHLLACRERLASLRQDVCYSAGRSALDWGRQSRGIRQRIVAAQIAATERINTGFALVSSALAVALVVCLFLFRTPEPTTIPVQISDAVLLNQVENQLDEELPDALQPANLLVGEMGGIQDQSAIRTVRYSHSRTRTEQ
jgi:hypothetical protein